MARILIVDDEPHIRDVVSAYLAREGYEVLTAADGDTALAMIGAEPPDLVVLDVTMPARSGLEVLRELRIHGLTPPVIMLTARDDVIDRVAALEVGADDYVTKPFEPRELVARVGAVLRRAAPGQAGGHDSATMAYLDLLIDPSRRAVLRGATDLGLTRTELDLLLALVQARGATLTREQLGERVFGEQFEASDRTIDSHVKNLRRKLSDPPADESYIETVRGVGYRSTRR